MNEPKTIRLFTTDEHDCSYLPGRKARTQFLDPSQRMTPELYQRLNQSGFRRSGQHFYRPKCLACNACQSLRVPVDEFRPSRSQRRNRRDNTDLQSRLRMPDEAQHESYFRLYRDYIDRRHGDGEMSPASRYQYDAFIGACLPQSRFLEFWEGERLIMVALTDRMADGYSAIYSFYDPDAMQRGLGNYAILRQIELVAAEGLDYLYLGYWIRESAKMSYKARYRPCEVYRDGQWQRL